MSTNPTASVGIIVLLIICILLGYEFVTFDNEPSLDAAFAPREDLTPQILDEMKKLEVELAQLKSAQHDQPAQSAFNPEEIKTVLNQFYENLSQKFSLNEESMSAEPTGQTETTTHKEQFKNWKNRPLAEWAGQYALDKCEKKEKVYFLKTSKTGSTTMANILMRFGFKRPGTNFLMGESPNGAMFFLNGYMPFNERLCYMGRDIPERPPFDISYVHMRYNKTAIDKVMHPNTFKVSILRDPLANFISSWKYYNGLTKEMRVLINQDIEPKRDMEKDPDWYAEIEQFLKQPWDYLKTFAYSHSAYLFVVNPQFIFFGYPSYLLRNTQNRLIELVNSWIGQIENDFDHILILEDLDRSLAVLMLKLCWEIDDVVHLKLNAMAKDGKTISMTAKKQLHELNWADYKLYEYFTRKLDREVRALGVERVASVAKAIVKRAGEVSAECLQPDKTTGWISSPIIKAEKRRNQTCHMYVKDISGWIEAEQLIRWKNQYPEWRMSESKKKGKKITGRKLPNFCGPNESFPEWLSKKDKDFRDFLRWDTDNNDFRDYVPDYLKEFAAAPTKKEQSNGYYKIFN